MNIRSAKAKGRRAAEETQKSILRHLKNLLPEDIIITPSSVNGPDLLLSPKASEAFPFSIECKNQERLNIWSALGQAKSHAKPNHITPLLIFRRNHETLKVCLSFDVFMQLFTEKFMKEYK